MPPPRSRAVWSWLRSTGFSCPAKLHMGRAQRLDKVGDQTVEWPVDRVTARDQYIVGARAARKRKHRRGCGSEPAFRPVAHHGTADFLAGGESNPKCARNYI